MVYETSTLITISLQSSLLTLRKELSFRCAILFVGLLMSNAFGSVSCRGILWHSGIVHLYHLANGCWNLVSHGWQRGNSCLEMVRVHFGSIHTKKFRSRLFYIEVCCFHRDSAVITDYISRGALRLLSDLWPCKPEFIMLTRVLFWYSPYPDFCCLITSVHAP
jgi:hypothetical protein